MRIQLEIYSEKGKEDKCAVSLVPLKTPFYDLQLCLDGTFTF